MLNKNVARIRKILIPLRSKVFWKYFNLMEHLSVRIFCESLSFCDIYFLRFEVMLFVAFNVKYEFMHLLEQLYF